MRCCDSLPPVSPRFVSFAWRYHRCVRCSSPPAPDAEPWINLELVGGISSRLARWKRQGLPSSRRYPCDHSPYFCDPGVTRQVEWTMSELPGAAPATDHDEGSPRVVISGLIRTAFDLAVYASQGRLPTHHARLASGCWSGSTGRDWLPAGFHLKGFKLPTILLVCLFPASLAYWRQRREECCNPPEALTSLERLLPPARAQGFGTSCGLDRLSQGSPCPRSSGGDSRLPRRRMSPGSLPVFSLRRSPVSTIASLDRIGVGIDTARYGHRVSFLRPDRKPAAKPLTVMENRAGYQALQDRLNQLHEQYPTANFHVRIDAAGQYAVNLELFLRSLSSLFVDLEGVRERPGG